MACAAHAHLLVGRRATGPERHGELDIRGPGTGRLDVRLSRPVTALAADVRNHGRFVEHRWAAIGQEGRVALETLERIRTSVAAARRLEPLLLAVGSLPRSNVGHAFVSKDRHPVLEDRRALGGAIRQCDERGGVMT